MRSLLTIGLVLLAVWVLAWLVFKVVGWVIHLLLIAAVVFIVWSLVKRGARRIR